MGCQEPSPLSPSETCRRRVFLIFYDLLQKRLRIPAEQPIVCGMALGYSDLTTRSTPSHRIGWRRVSS
jgi:hypothetical protein